VALIRRCGAETIRSIVRILQVRLHGSDRTKSMDTIQKPDHPFVPRKPIIAAAKRRRNGSERDGLARLGDKLEVRYGPSGVRGASGGGGEGTSSHGIQMSTYMQCSSRGISGTFAGAAAGAGGGGGGSSSASATGEPIRPPMAAAVGPSA
jgi:hypothetical protein